VIERSGPSSDLTKAVKDAVGRTLQTLAEAHSGEGLVGYALVTDDDIRSLGYMACTRESLESPHNPAVRFEPVDWPYGGGDEAFDEARGLLAVSGDAAASDHAFAAHVNRSFAALVEALRELRQDGRFHDGVFLTVISTDPSEHLERLEADAVRTLNSPELHGRWTTRSSDA
jgi:uncharacterized protein DUF4303